MSQAPVAGDGQEGINCPLMHHLSPVDDPRNPKLRVHLLYDIVVIIVLGMVCGSKYLVLVETWAREKEEFLRTFLRLPGGIPSHDTTQSRAIDAAACSTATVPFAVLSTWCWAK